MLIKVAKKIDVKGATLKDNTLSGVPNVMGILDRGRDVIFPGAFNRKGALDRFKGHGFIAVGHDYGRLPVAMPTAVSEKGANLESTCEFHSTRDGQDARTVAKERIAKGLSVPLSIGFDMDHDDFEFYANGKALLAAAKKIGCDMSLFDTATIAADNGGMMRGIASVSDLWEWSFVPIGMNQESFATDAKGADGEPIDLKTLFTEEVKRASGARDLPLAPRETKWDASGAKKRVQELCGAVDGPNKRYARAFLCVDGDASAFGSYKLPFADVVDGELHAVPNAIMAAAEAIDGARGGVSIPEVDVDGVKDRLRHYYERMASVFEDDTIKAPFDAKKSVAASEIKSLHRPWWMDTGDDETTAADATIAALNVLQSDLNCDIYTVLYDSDMTIGEKVDALKPSFEENSANSIAVIRALLEVLQDDSNGDDDDAKAAKLTKALARLAIWAKGASVGAPPLGQYVRIGADVYGQVVDMDLEGKSVSVALYGETDEGFTPTGARESHPFGALTRTEPLRAKAAPFDLTTITIRQMERRLRDAGMTLRQAKKIAPHAHAGLLRDAEETAEAKRAEVAARESERTKSERLLSLREKEIEISLRLAA